VVRRQLNRKRGLAADSEISALFKDCEPGAIPPLGEAYSMDAILDESLIGSPDIYFQAGDHETLVHVTGDDFLRLMIGVPRGEISHHAW
jgi:Ala-tRNA(Pro) deacylase